MKERVLILGVHLKNEGYPNVLYRVKGLKSSEWCDVEEINEPMFADPSGVKRPLLFRFAKAVYAHLLVLAKFFLVCRVSSMYIPYPAIFVAYIISLLPKFLRPKRIVLDAFISIYDTVINDRKLLASDSLTAKLLKHVEGRAYTAADVVVVDTPHNRSYLCDEFNLDKGKVVSVPLSTNEVHFVAKPYLQKNTSLCRVLFIGTFVPLQGVSVVFEAARELVGFPHIQFQIIGDGQTSEEVKTAMVGKPINLVWDKSWKTPEELSRLIGEADICLGVFGGTDKAQRVCPFKLYSYASSGRAILTGDTDWTADICQRVGYVPFERVEINNPSALARHIRRLAGSYETRLQLALSSRRFYEEELSNIKALEKFKMALLG
ncbi:MAG: glycosyltransferase [Colwellia sp.]|jgi:Glycosyltransferase